MKMPFNSGLPRRCAPRNDDVGTLSFEEDTLRKYLASPSVFASKIKSNSNYLPPEPRKRLAALGSINKGR